MTRVIGLTGGIGSGKSTVSHMLAEMGAVVIDADKVGHEAFKPGTSAWSKVVQTFGRDVVGSNGEIDRKKLGAIVFADPAALTRLNQIMHPTMREMIKAQIDEYRKQGVEVVVLEAAILIEAGWDSLVDEVWVTVAPQNAVMERLESQRGMAKEQTLARIKAQLPTEERVKHADVVIVNDGSLDDMRNKLKELWQKLHS